MKLKAGVDIKGLHIKMRPVLIQANKIWSDRERELVITCGLNGAHSAGSLHYYGRAVDLRTNYFEDGVVEDVAQELRDALGLEYDVVVEKTHIHAEYDPK